MTPAVATAAPPLQVDAIRDAAALAPLKAEWNSLLNSSRAPSLFLTWEWIRTWWDVYGGASRLFVLAVRDASGRLVGVAPFKSSRRAVGGVYRYNELEFIGQGGDVTPEYLDVIAATGYEASVRAAILGRLARDRSWGSINLQPFSTMSPHLDGLARELGGQGIVQMDNRQVCPVIE
ncbi:MAG TPA: hypothetical protein VE379_01440, partial [Vicinamibacterales bacterium]|nr:hypothetical protein [Vicinamibacterales bacterium]